MNIWHVVLVDGLFLLGLVCLGCWFRVWRRAEGRAFDRRIKVLRAQQERLEQLLDRLDTTGRQAAPPKVQRPTRSGAEETGLGVLKRLKRPIALDQPKRTYNAEQAYSQARSLLGAGMDSGEVARNLELGIAEVEALRRVLQHEDRAARR